MLVEDVYYHCLKQLNFSISGHEQLEDRVVNFFDKATDTSLFSLNPSYTFFLGILLRLQDYKVWKVKSFKSFYYRSFEAAFKVPVIGFYLYLLEYFGGYSESTSVLMSKLFVKPQSILVKLHSNSEKPYVRWDHRFSCLTIHLPLSLFDKAVLENKDDVKEYFFRLLEAYDFASEADWSVKKSRVNSRLYRRELGNIEELDTKLKQIAESIYDEQFDVIASQLQEILIKRYKYLLNEDEADIDELVSQYSKMCLAQSFLCLYYDSCFEYFISPVKVDYLPDGKRTYLRNIGGIGIGYKSSHTLSVEHRVLITVMSDRVSAAVAGDVLAQENRWLSYLKESEDWRRKVNKLISGEFLTDLEMNTESGKTTRLKDSVNEYFHGREVLTNEIESAIISYFTKNPELFYEDYKSPASTFMETGKKMALNDLEISKYHLFHLCGASGGLENLESNDEWLLQGHISPLSDFNHICDIRFLNRLFAKFNSDPSKGIQIIEDDICFPSSSDSNGNEQHNEICRRVKLKHPWDFRKFCELLQAPAIGEGGVESPGNLTQFIRDNYRRILLNGNLVFRVNGKPFFNLLEDVRYSQETKQFKLLTDYEQIHNDLASEDTNYEYCVQILVDG